MTTQTFLGGSELNITEEIWNATMDWMNETSTEPMRIIPPRSRYNYRLDPLFIVGKSLNNNKYFFLCPVALVLNGLALFVIGGRIARQSSFLYMGLLAIFDALAILMRTVYLLVGMHKVSMSGAACKIVMFLNNHFTSYSVWILIAMTFERVLAVWKPLRMHDFCTVRRAIIVLVFLAVLFIGQHAYIFDAIDSFYHRRLRIYVCATKKDYADFRKVYSWVDTSVYSFIPTVVIFVLNAIVIIGMRQAFKRQMRMTNNARDPNKEALQSQMTIMLLTVSVMFFILTTPRCIFHVYSFFWKFKIGSKEYATYVFASSITGTLSDLNHCVNFLLYFVSGKQFRNDFVKRFRCRRPTPNTYSTAMTKTNINTVSSAVSISKGNTRV